MLESGERGDCLSWFDEESGVGFWRSELKSVKERREAFLCKMGFDDVSDSEAESVGVELDRMLESGGALSCLSDLYAFGDGAVEISVRDENGEANVVAGESGTELSCGLMMEVGVDLSAPVSSKAEMDHWKFGSDKGGLNWWKKIANKRVKGNFLSMARKCYAKVPEICTTKVQASKKVFRAHKGVIWTAKFSPNGEFLATGSWDGVVRVWRVTSADVHEKLFLDHEVCKREIKGEKTGFRRQKKVHVPVMSPDRAFAIKESPVHEFQGHAGHILDLSWSNSNLILSSSNDGTVRLWQVGSKECLGVFRHSDSVTCVQFNPTDDGYFVTGSLDGKIRIWRVSEGRVVDWDDAREAVSAIAYQPDGQGLVACSLNGSCRFYDTSGFSIHFSTHIQIRGGKRSGNRITRIQFCPENPQRVMIMSEDSKVRVFDKTTMIKTYKGLPKSGAQVSASFTLNPKHIEDSRVTRVLPQFHSEGVSFALPWSSYKLASEVSSSGSRCAKSCCARPQGHRDYERVSLAKWFSLKDTSSTWPEEILPLQDFHRVVEKEWRYSCCCWH